MQAYQKPGLRRSQGTPARHAGLSKHAETLGIANPPAPVGPRVPPVDPTVYAMYPADASPGIRPGAARMYGTHAGQPQGPGDDTGW